jgi:hypothetical protein
VVKFSAKSLFVVAKGFFIQFKMIPNLVIKMNKKNTDSKAVILSITAILALFMNTIAQSGNTDKIKQDIKHNTTVVSKKAAKYVEYVAKESGKNIKKISEKTAVGVEKTVKKIDVDVKKKKATKK